MINLNTKAIEKIANGNGNHGFGAGVREAVEKEKLGENKVIEHAAVLQEILDNLPNDFSFGAVAKIPDDDVTITQKRIITVEQVLKTAIDCNVGLCRYQDFLFGFNGAFWSVLERDDITQLLVDAAEKLGVSRYKARDYKFADELYKQFIRDAALPAPETSDEIKINVLTGTLIFKDGKLSDKPFDRADFIKYQLPFEFDEKADYPQWQAFLDRVLPEKNERGETIDAGKSRQKILAEYIGYVFTRKPKLEQTLLCYGTGANGKSVFFDVVNALLGKDNISNYSLESLTENYFRAKLANKLLNYASEISTRLQAETFKKLTSGEAVEARLPYGQPMIIKNYARLAFNCNELPRDVEHTDGFFRRFLIVPFDVTIPEYERDADLAEKIIASELSGVFNWVLEGLERIVKNRKFSECLPAKNILSRYRKESDSVAMFLEDEKYKASAEHKISGAEIFRSYRTYCTENGYHSLGKHKFFKRLEFNGISREDSSQPFFYIELY